MQMLLNKFPDWVRPVCNPVLVDVAINNYIFIGCVLGQIAATVQAFLPIDLVALELEGTVAAIPSRALCA